MIKKKILLVVITAALGISVFMSSNVNAASQTKRFCGKDRYETCSAIVQEGWKETSDYAVVVNGDNFPDALSATTLAKKYSAPILLTQSNTLDTNTSKELKRLNVKEVFIVGGASVVTTNVENAIKNLGIQVVRYAGQDRNDTSIKVAEQIGTSNGIILTTDSDYTDALSAAPIAAKLQIPIILMPKDTTPDSVKKFLVGKSISKTYVLGGTDLISTDVANKFPNVVRIGGNDKYERNINIISAFSDSLNFKNVCFAYSEKFPDALSGSAFSAINGNPIVLVGNSPEDVTKKFIQDKLDLVNNFYVLGGTAGLSDNEVNELTNVKVDNNDEYLKSDEGNTEGNLNNGGLMVQKDDWIYYTKNGNGIYKAKTDGTQEAKLTDDKGCKNINVTNGYIFYVCQSKPRVASIFRIDLTGGNKTIFNGFVYTSDSNNSDINDINLSDYKLTYPYMRVVGQWLYYSPNVKFFSVDHSSFYNELFKINIDNGPLDADHANSSTPNRLSGYYFSTISIDNNYIYFTKVGDKKIRKMTNDGQNESLVSDCQGDVLYALNGWIYYKDIDGNTYQIKNDGTSKTKVANIPSNSIINGNEDYYVSSGQDDLYQLHKMNIDGTEDTPLNAYKVDKFSIIGNWIYYYNMANNNIHKIKLDGTSRDIYPISMSIKTVDDIHVKIKQGDMYKLPSTVLARMTDDSTELFSIKWDSSNVDTSKVGTYTIHGTMDNYSGSVNLVIDVYSN